MDSVAQHHLKLLVMSADCKLWDHSNSFLASVADSATSEFNYAHFESFHRVFISSEPHIRFCGVHRVNRAAAADSADADSRTGGVVWIPTSCGSDNTVRVSQVLIFGSNAHEREIIVRLLKKTVRALYGCFVQAELPALGPAIAASGRITRPWNLLIAPSSGVSEFMFFTMWQRLSGRFKPSGIPFLLNADSRNSHDDIVCNSLIQAVEPCVEFLFQQISEALQNLSLAGSSMRVTWLLHMQEMCSFVASSFETLSRLSLENSFIISDQRQRNGITDPAARSLLFASYQWQQWLATAARIFNNAQPVSQSCASAVVGSAFQSTCSGKLCWAGNVMDSLVLIFGTVNILLKWHRSAYFMLTTRQCAASHSGSIYIRQQVSSIVVLFEWQYPLLLVMIFLAEQVSPGNILCSR